MGRPIFPSRFTAANINLEQFRSELSDEMELEAALPDDVARKRARQLTPQAIMVDEGLKQGDEAEAGANWKEPS